MSKTVLITLNNSGNDPGPYDLTLIDGVGNETPWPSNPVTKAQLIAGYQMTVPDLIVKVKVKSKTCTTFVQLTIPTTQCPCRIVTFFPGDRSNVGDGVFNFYQCGEIIPTALTATSGFISYCVDMNKPIIQSSTTGGFIDTGICCPPGVNPVPTPTTTTSTTTTSTTSTTSTTTTTTSLITTTSSTTTSTTSTSSTTTSTTNNVASCALFTFIGGSGGRTFIYTPCGQSSPVILNVPAGDEIDDCVQLPWTPTTGAIQTGTC